MAELLDLSKVAHRDTMTMPTVGKAKKAVVREVINQTDLGILEFARLQELQDEARHLTTLASTKKATAKQEVELLRVLGELVKMLIPTITPAELRQLSRQNREQVVLVWIINNSEQGDAANPPEAIPPTGAGSSQGSKRSTAATRKRGGTSRSGRSSRT